ncbi:MaoC family dehydratase N-terminal domain-containing protein [Thermodesulfobacteriota bacterium]
MEDPKSFIGKESAPYVFEVDMNNIHDFALAIGDDDPIFCDKELAKTSRFSGIIASNTFNHALRGDKSTLIRAIPQIGARIPEKLLHGEHEIEYFKPLRPGDTITFTIKIIDIFERTGKRSGVMDVVVLEMACYNQHDENVLNYRQTFVIRRK